MFPVTNSSLQLLKYSGVFKIYDFKHFNLEMKS